MGNDEPARDASFLELEASLYSALVFQGIVKFWGSEKGGLYSEMGVTSFETQG